MICQMYVMTIWFVLCLRYKNKQIDATDPILSHSTRWTKFNNQLSHLKTRFSKNITLLKKHKHHKK